MGTCSKKCELRLQTVELNPYEKKLWDDMIMLFNYVIGSG